MHRRPVDAAAIVVEDESRRRGALRIGHGALPRAGVAPVPSARAPDRDHALRCAAARRRRPLREGEHADRAVGLPPAFARLARALAARSSRRCSSIARIPSALVAPAAGVLCAGILGNSLSAAWNGMEVPNPFVVGFEHGLVAFNLADVWALVGIFLLVLAIGVWLIRNRAPAPAAGRGACDARTRRSGGCSTTPTLRRLGNTTKHRRRSPDRLP